MKNKYKPGVDKDEKKFERLNELSQKLGIPIPEVHLKIDLQNPGEETQTVCNRRSRSFVRNFYNYIYTNAVPSDSIPSLSGIYGQGSLNGFQTSGTVTNFLPKPFFLNGDSNIFTPGGVGSGSGINVGLSNRPENFNQFRLDFASHSGIPDVANTFLYQATTRSVSYDPTSRTWSTIYTRIYNNNSGASVVVKETAFLISRSSGGFFMVSRDVLNTEITVLNGGQLTVSYTWTFTFPQ
jgi:hypothetical protein